MLSGDSSSTSCLGFSTQAELEWPRIRESLKVSLVWLSGKLSQPEIRQKLRVGPRAREALKSILNGRKRVCPRCHHSLSLPWTHAKPSSQVHQYLGGMEPRQYVCPSGRSSPSLQDATHLRHHSSHMLCSPLDQHIQQSAQYRAYRTSPAQPTSTPRVEVPLRAI